VVPHPFRTVAAFLAAAVFGLATTGAVFAHVVEHAGPYTIEIGWAHEPTYVGEANGVQVIVTRDAKPVTDLAADDLKVVVSTGDQQSGELTFEPGFDPIEMEGPLGEYDAAIVPTAPGEYTFHLTGTVHGQAVDVTVSSGDETFNAVQGTSDIEFPTKLPTVPEIVTRLDRIDARIANPAADTGPTQASVDAASAKARDASSAADRALLVGGGIGIVGIAVGALGVLIALRANRQPAA
jgi:hypothetical protein